MSNTLMSNGHIDSLIQYVLDVKPYHVKLAGGIEQYVFHEDTLAVEMKDAHQMMVVLGPDYTNASSNVERKVWEYTSPRPPSSMNGTRVVQSDGTRSIYNIPALMYHKNGADSNAVLERTIATQPTEIPGLNIGVVDQRAFFQDYPNTYNTVRVKKNGALLEEDTDYIVSRGAFSFNVNGTARTWKQHNLSLVPNIPFRSGSYGFADVRTRFGAITNIVVSQSGVYEEWRLTYDTPTTVKVVGSTSGQIGIATHGVAFSNPLISFIYQENVGDDPMPMMVAGDEFVLTPSNKICIHPGATNQVWTLIAARGHYKVFGSVSGWVADAIVGKWYDNGQIAFKVPKLEAWVWVNGVSLDIAATINKSVYTNCQSLILDGSFGLDNEQDLDGDYYPLDAIPCLYSVTFRESSPSTNSNTASVFNNQKGHLPGLENNVAWNDGWLTIKTEGAWVPGDHIKVVLAPEGLHSWLGGYDEAPYEWTFYDMLAAERAIPVDMLQEYFPLYHSKDAIVLFNSAAGDVVEVDKTQNEIVRLRFGQGEALPDSLGAEDGWIPLTYKPNAILPEFVTQVDAYLGSDPNVLVFSVVQPNLNGKPGITRLEFNRAFFTDYISSAVLLTFQFKQTENSVPKVGVNLSEELHIQVNTIVE